MADYFRPGKAEEDGPGTQVETQKQFLAPYWPNIAILAI